VFETCVAERVPDTIPAAAGDRFAPVNASIAKSALRKTLAHYQELENPEDKRRLASNALSHVTEPDTLYSLAATPEARSSIHNIQADTAQFCSADAYSNTTQAAQEIVAESVHLELPPNHKAVLPERDTFERQGGRKYVQPDIKKGFERTVKARDEQVQAAGKWGNPDAYHQAPERQGRLEGAMFNAQESAASTSQAHLTEAVRATETDQAQRTETSKGKDQVKN